MDIPESVRDDLESRANVVGTCCGPKRVRGQTTDEESLVVLVSEKLPEAQLDDEDVVPRELEIDGRRIRTDVQEVGDVRLQSTTARRAAQRSRTDRWRPAPAGVSFGHPAVSAGTLGSPPLETENGEAVVLTNAHVAAPPDAASEGDDVLQPGPADGGTTDDVIGTLHDFVEVTTDRPNTTDSALVSVDPDDVGDEVLEVGPLEGFAEPSTGATYTKSGRTTGVTTGELRGRDVRIRVGGVGDGQAVFEGVDLFGPMSAAGDSGSLIGTDDDGFRATNLLFAGSDRATLGVPIAAVEAAHGTLTPRRSDDAPEDPGAPGAGGPGRPGRGRRWSLLEFLRRLLPFI